MHSSARCGTAHIGHQHGVLHPGHAADPAHHFLGIAQHRDGLGRGEGGDFNFGEAAVTQSASMSCTFGVSGDEFGFILKAIAGDDFIEI